jgi:hypothetical protein
MFDPAALQSFSFGIPRLGLPPIRVHWTVILLIAFDISGVSNGRGYGDAWPIWLILAVIPLFWFVHWTHEIAHRMVARWVGIGMMSTVLLMLVGGQSQLVLKRRVWPLVAYASSGILVNLAIGFAAWFGGSALLGNESTLIMGFLLRYIGYASLRLGFFNLLLPIFPFDAGLLQRALLWPITGLRRSVSITLITAYVIIGLIVISAIFYQNLMYLILGLSLLWALVNEHRSVNAGHDPWLGEDPAYFGHNRAIWDNWKQRRLVATQERVAKEEEAESATLDRLLDKVSEQGLPSLTAQERNELERISKRQRERESG